MSERYLTETEARRLMEEAVDKAVERTAPIAIKAAFVSMGMDPEKPLEAQKDAQFLRSTRERCEKATWQAVTVFIGVVALGAIGMLLAGFKGWIVDAVNSLNPPSPPPR